MKIVGEERGQASLMIGMMMMTFILLFAFVVNTGMLVNAKINLQNAADLAAYSGAAVQARQLNDISYLNYEMRRQYKKFLYRYYVIGNMASANFPRGGGAGQASTPVWGPDLNDPLYGVPAVCVAFTSTGPQDNYCQVKDLTGIAIPPTNAGALGAFDLINATLAQQLTAIEKLRQDNCGRIAMANTSLLLLWLFNTSPDLQSLSAAIAGTDESSQDARSILQISRAAAQGLGLVPREIILNERINTLASYVNMPPQAGVKIATVNGFKQSIDPPAEERTIQAFLSAYYTLGNHTFSDDNQIVMDELLPNGGDQSNLLALQPVKEDFDTYSVQFQTVGNAVNSADCVPDLTPITVHSVPVGVAKDPRVLTFYAIRLRATAKVLFSPFGDMQLTAYAAARPFGSRIGPPLTTAETQFTMSATGNGVTSTSGTSGSSGIVGKIPNLPVSLADQQSGLGAGKGWDNNALLGTMYSQFFSSANPTGTELDSTNFAAGLRAGMVPNPVEGNVYNILNYNAANNRPSAPDPFARSFDALHQMSFWAPVISPSKVSNLKNVLSTDLTAILGGTGAPQNAITGSNSAADLEAALAPAIIDYVNALESGQGEILAGAPDGSGRCLPDSCVQEGMNIAHIQDPFVQATGQPIQLSSSIMIQPSDSATLKTSYVTTLDPAFQAQGRVGYSVKFVSFDSLTKTGTDANGSGIIDKPAGFLDTQAERDVRQMQH